VPAISSQNRDDDMAFDEVKELLKDANLTGLNKGNCYVHNPIGGEVYLFNCSGLTDPRRRLMQIDMLPWKSKARRKAGTRLDKNTTKEQFHYRLPNNKTCGDFRKYVYINEKTAVAMIHYKGDHEVAEERKKTTSKKTTRTYHPNNYLIEMRVREIDPEGKMKPGDLYNALLTQPEYQHLAGDKFLIVQPRNVDHAARVQRGVRFDFM
jgi:hypothetical protein